MATSSQSKDNPIRMYPPEKSPLQNLSLNYGCHLTDFSKLRQGLGNEVFNNVMNTSVVGLLLNLAGRGYTRSAHLVHQFLTNELLLTKDLTEPELQDVEVPIFHEGPITRQRAKILQHKYNQSMMQAMSQVDQVKPQEDQEVDPLKAQAWTGLLKECQELANGPDSKNQDVWPLLPNQAQIFVMTISTMHQDT
ncbi:uncharacterized protein LOC112087974 isoform X2 [Eutrema salsugineum]|nr:uncharacterized protein LOC112087974 isoform X2 [Eutrema salsugineum]